MSLLNQERRTSNVRARTHVELLVMSGEDFTALAYSSSLFGNLLDTVIEQRRGSGGTARVGDE